MARTEAPEKTVESLETQLQEAERRYQQLEQAVLVILNELGTYTQAHYNAVMRLISQVRAPQAGPTGPAGGIDGHL